MINRTLLLLVIPFLFIACSSSKEEIQFKKPKIQIPKKPPVVKKNKGSLYSVRGASLFADKKDLQIGDIVQVVIRENLSSNSKNKRELTSNRANSLGGGLLAGTGTNKLGGVTSKVANELNGTIGVDFKTNSSTSDKGEVKTQFNESFNTTISAIIEEIYENGNYYVKGSKEMLIEGQKQEIIVSGVIRPYDITSDNSITSSQMANLKVLYDKEGQEADILETPWGLKLFRAIWPF